MNVFPKPTLANVLTKEPEVNPVNPADQEVLENARDVIERASEIEKEAWERGYRQGMEEAKRESLDMLVNVVRGNIDSIAELEQSMVDVCLDAYRSFFGLLGHERMLAGLVHKAIGQLSAHQTVVVRTSPAELDAVKRGLSEAALPMTTVVSFVPDQEVGDGECIVETDTTTTHLNINTHVEVLFELLKKHFV